MLQDDENLRACRIHIIQQRMRDINRHVRIEGSTCLHHNTSIPILQTLYTVNRPNMQELTSDDTRLLRKTFSQLCGIVFSPVFEYRVCTTLFTRDYLVLATHVR